MRQKINKDIQDLNSDLEQVNLIKIYRALHFKYTKYTFSTLNTQNIDRPLLIPNFFQNKAIFPFTLPLSLLFLPLLYLFIYFFFPSLKKKKSTCKPLDPGRQCLFHCLISFLPFPPSPLPPFLPSFIPSFLPTVLIPFLPAFLPPPQK